MRDARLIEGKGKWIYLFEVYALVVFDEKAIYYGIKKSSAGKENL